MKGNFNRCFELVLAEEGGYTNNEKDPGGRTNLGVTQRSWEAWSLRSSSEKEMKSLTPEMVKPFYYKQYWVRLRCDELASGLDYAVMDLAVNSGSTRAVRYLQQLAGVPQDGMLGNKSMEAIVATDAKQMIDGICDMRIEFLNRLTNFQFFGKGWTSRVSRVKAKALEMAEAENPIA